MMTLQRGPFSTPSVAAGRARVALSVRFPDCYAIESACAVDEQPKSSPSNLIGLDSARQFSAH